MPTQETLTFPRSADLNEARIREILERRFGGKYSFRWGTKPGQVAWVFPSQWKGACVILQRKPDSNETRIRVFGGSPSLAHRLILTVLFAIPMLYVQLVASQPIIKEVAAALNNELGGTAGTEPAEQTR
jgi:hypothetical protein